MGRCRSFQGRSGASPGGGALCGARQHPRPLGDAWRTSVALALAVGVGLLLRSAAPTMGEVACCKPVVRFILGGARCGGLHDGGAGRTALPASSSAEF
jgi:hypothetical protein